jgi:hypothetical protein
MLRFLTLLTLAFVLTACGAGGSVPVGNVVSTPLASADTDWTVHFTYAGGIAGMMRTMEIHSNGQAVINDARTGKSVTVQLTPDQLGEMRQLADEAVYKPASGPSQCADCFLYTVEIDTGNGAKFSAQADDMNLDDSGLAPLVNFLKKIVDDGLKS